MSRIKKKLFREILLKCKTANENDNSALSSVQGEMHDERKIIMVYRIA